MTREEAIALAAKYCLEREVTEFIDELGYSPEEALDEWVK